MSLPFDNQYARQFKNIVTEQPIHPDGKGTLRLFNAQLWQQLGGQQPPDELVDWASGQAPWPGSQPLAQKYAGHQFGHFNPFLGDGRGLLLGEINSPELGYVDLHVKGSGPTPYGRGGDGRAVLRSSIREYLGSEALAALGIPTTRALALLSTEGQIQRERVEPGAMLLRVAQTHVRFGHFEHCYYRKLQDTQAQLWDYVMQRQWPDIADTPIETQFRRVMERTATMIACWQAYGFIHGVMNTDNMSLVGETFDFGPYAVLDDYQPEKIFNHTDSGGRYGFLQQPGIGLWNLQRLLHALTLNYDGNALTPVLDDYEGAIQRSYFELMRQRLGLTDVEETSSRRLIAGWLQLLEQHQWDYNRSFIQLEQCFTEEPDAQWLAQAGDWFIDYQQAVKGQPDIATMQQVNPVVTLRTHLLAQVIEASERQDDAPLTEYLAQLSSPFERALINSHWAQPPAAAEQVSELSCSS